MRIPRRSVLVVACLGAIVGLLAVAAPTVPPDRAGPRSPTASSASAGAATPSPRVASPTASPPQVPVLRRDGMATVLAALVVWKDPRARPRDRLVHGLPVGTSVYLAAGPRSVAGRTWWQVQPLDDTGLGLQFGWIQGADEHGRQFLDPLEPDCPSSDQPVDARAIQALGTLRGLSCFGNRELTIDGQLTCVSGTADFAVGGASFLDAYQWCSIDDALHLNGPAATSLMTGPPPRNPISGHYAVRGHFDDPEAHACFFIAFGAFVSTPIAPPDAGAVITCRQSFVVDAVRRIDAPSGSASPGAG